MNYTMNFSDYRFTLDIQLHQAQVSIPVTYGDSARRLCVGLTDGRKPYTIGEGCLAVFNAKKPDNTIIKNYCVIENNTVIYEFTPNTTSCEGIVNCDITIYDVDGKELTSPRFVIVVDEAVVRDDEIPESEFTAFAEAIKEESLRKANENERIANENLRCANEDERNIGEYGSYDYHWDNDKWCVVDGNGNPVPDNEINGRVGAEKARVEAEKERVSNETARAWNESKRQEAEEAREAIIGDIGSALDSILAIQSALLPKILTFTLNNTDKGVITTYEFEEGMTWGEWVESEYNTDGFYCEGFGMVQNIGGYIYKNQEERYNVYKDEVIEAEYEYYLYL